MVPPYFKDQSVPPSSYSYTLTVAPKIFNKRRVLQDYSIVDLKAKPPDCSCHNSPFKYNTVDHVATGNLIIIDNENLRKIPAVQKF
jgi:hypothetical protein